jgi:AraC family transcriptional regulator of arabinose operon
LSATQLADELNVSREYLSRLFKKHLKKSPYQYILEHKIANASWRLQHSTDSIKEVAFTFGFGTPEMFCRSFRKIHGISPSQYRKQ